MSLRKTNAFLFLGFLALFAGCNQSIEFSEREKIEIRPDSVLEKELVFLWVVESDLGKEQCPKEMSLTVKPSGEGIVHFVTGIRKVGSSSSCQPNLEKTFGSYEFQISSEENMQFKRAIDTLRPTSEYLGLGELTLEKDTGCGGEYMADPNIRVDKSVIGYYPSIMTVIWDSQDDRGMIQSGFDKSCPNDVLATKTKQLFDAIQVLPIESALKAVEWTWPKFEMKQ